MNISDDFLKMLREQIAKRDLLATRMGAARYAYLQSEHEMLLQIDRSMKEQAAIGNLAIKNAGVDPDSGNYTIDLETGEIKKT